MALKPMSPGAVSTATVVSDLPDMPQDLADRTAVAKWWFDTRLVFQRLLSDIERRRNVGGTEPVTEYSPTWDSITGKPDKFPPEDHSHVAGKATPLVQVVAEDPLVAGTTDPDTGKADIGFHEQTAATFLAGPVIGPPQLPVFRPILLSDLPASVRDMPTGGNPGTYDQLNGSTGGGTHLGTIAVQSRGGSWSLVGHVAYLGMEPTRRWRLRTFGGSRTGYNGYTGCAGMSVSGAAQQAGTQYVEDDGSVTRTSLVTPTAGDGLGYSAPTAITDAYGLCASSEGTGYCRTTTITATLVSTVGVGGGGSGCCTPDGTLYYGYAGTTTAALSAEDLPPAAIERMLATAEWGEATTAIQTIPTVGITGVYREARYRTEHTSGSPAVTSPTLIGLSPWQRYQVTVTLESRPVDSAGAPTGDGSWSAAGTRTHYFVADIEGEGGIDWQVVEPTAGYETRIGSTLVEVA